MGGRWGTVTLLGAGEATTSAMSPRLHTAGFRCLSLNEFDRHTSVEKRSRNQRYKHSGRDGGGVRSLNMRASGCSLASPSRRPQAITWRPSTTGRPSCSPGWVGLVTPPRSQIVPLLCGGHCKLLHSTVNQGNGSSSAPYRLVTMAEVSQCVFQERDQ
jgi:hypothetical protein